MIKIQINKTNIKETNNIYLGVSAQFQIEKSFVCDSQLPKKAFKCLLP